jgi:hypothetical protein
MNNLIEALTIMKDYIQSEYSQKFPTHCEHNILTVAADPANIPEDVLEKLSELGFEADHSEGFMFSYRFGSC